MDKHKRIIDQITEDHVDENVPLRTADDDDLNEAQRQRIRDYGKGHEQRDVLYAELLQQYIEINKSKAEWNKWYKLFFFVVTLAILVALVIVPMVIYWNISRKCCVNSADVAVVIGCTAGIISSIIVLPKIIAQHLFPTNEDEHMIGIVKNMQLNDSQIRDVNRRKNDSHTAKQYKPKDHKK